MLVPSVLIQNKNGVTMLIDEEDLGLLTQHRNGYWCFYITRGYAQMYNKKIRGGDGRNIIFHRLVMKALVGVEVDHVNRNRLDNRKENLRFCTRSQNVMNSAVIGVSRFRGVSSQGQKWRANIRLDSVLKHLGTFTTEIEAALAYDAAARQLSISEFRFLNFPDENPSA